jgi:hypothetical protein
MAKHRHTLSCLRTAGGKLVCKLDRNPSERHGKRKGKGPEVHEELSPREAKLLPRYMREEMRHYEAGEHGLAQARAIAFSKARRKAARGHLSPYRLRITRRDAMGSVTEPGTRDHDTFESAGRAARNLIEAEKQIGGEGLRIEMIEILDLGDGERVVDTIRGTTYRWERRGGRTSEPIERSGEHGTLEAAAKSAIAASRRYPRQSVTIYRSGSPTPVMSLKDGESYGPTTAVASALARPPTIIVRPEGPGQVAIVLRGNQEIDRRREVTITAAEAWARSKYPEAKISLWQDTRRIGPPEHLESASPSKWTVVSMTREGNETRRAQFSHEAVAMQAALHRIANLRAYVTGVYAPGGRLAAGWNERTRIF